jgi:hypothetical protein
MLLSTSAEEKEDKEEKNNIYQKIPQILKEEKE